MIRNLLLPLFFSMFLFSCTNRNLTYLSNLDEHESVHEITNKVEPIIQAGDLLKISITSLSPESNALFINGVTSAKGDAAGTKANEGFLVDKNGQVTFPILGKMLLAGLTTEDASEKIANMIGKYAKEPIVDIRFLNFKVTVIGEVAKPSTFTIPTEKINIFEALGLAGDMTAYGRRENVLLIREQNGDRLVKRLNLNDKQVLHSPYFYLQQNDIIYVEADKAKAAQSSLSRSNFQFGLSIGMALVSVTSIFLSRVL